MGEEELRELLNRIIVCHNVNLHGGGDSINTDILDDFIKQIHEMLGEAYCIAVDIKNIRVKNEEKKAELLRIIINEEMAKKQFPHWIHSASTIEDLLPQLNERLEDPALIIFYQFTSPDDNDEKDWLRSIRQFIQMRESLFLKLLLISSERLEKWDLRPSSDIDERVLKYFPYD